MQTVRKIEASNVKTGDVICNHGKTNKEVLSVKHGESGKWIIKHECGYITYDYDDVLHILVK